jgi:hypothetical protein
MNHGREMLASNLVHAVGGIQPRKDDRYAVHDVSFLIRD